MRYTYVRVLCEFNCAFSMVEDSVIIERLFEAKAHHGHARSFRNPRMKPFLHNASGTKFDTINLSMVPHFVREVRILLEDVLHNSNNGIVLFVGDNIFLDAMSDIMEKLSAFYIAKWRGGLLTNFKTTRRSVFDMENNERKLEDAKMTKKELQKITRVVDKGRNFLGGIRSMNELPDVMFIAGVNKNPIAVAEARKANIPTIGIVDTDSDPYCVDCPVPCNDDFHSAMFTVADLCFSNI